MPRSLWPTLARGTVGFLLGLGLWAGFADAYSSFLATSAQPLLRLMERPAVTRLIPEGPAIVVNREDFPPSSPRPQIPVKDLTFNVILLTVLFASERAPFSTRNVTRFLLACLILSVTHVVAFVAAVESLYALRLGAWSAANYGPVSRNFWSGAAHFYRIAGVYGVAFLLWWTLRGEDAAEVTGPRRTRAGATAGGRRKRKRKRR